MADMKREGMQATHTLAVLLLGRTRVSIRLECNLGRLRLSSDLIRAVSSKRVFILGPSHHLYLEGCALSTCKEYDTPIGKLPLDLDSEHIYVHLL